MRHRHRRYVSSCKAAGFTTNQLTPFYAPLASLTPTSNQAHHTRDKAANYDSNLSQ